MKNCVIILCVLLSLAVAERFQKYTFYDSEDKKCKGESKSALYYNTGTCMQTDGVFSFMSYCEDEELWDLIFSDGHCGSFEQKFEYSENCPSNATSLPSELSCTDRIQEETGMITLHPWLDIYMRLDCAKMVNGTIPFKMGCDSTCSKCVVDGTLNHRQCNQGNSFSNEWYFPICEGYGL